MMMILQTQTKHGLFDFNGFFQPKDLNHIEIMQEELKRPYERNQSPKSKRNPYCT